MNVDDLTVNPTPIVDNYQQSLKPERSPTLVGPDGTEKKVVQSDTKNIEGPAKSLSEPDIEKMTEAVNDHLESLQTKIGLSISEKYDNQIIVEVRSKDTDEVIRELPPEDLLKLKDKMEDLAGILFNQTV